MKKGFYAILAALTVFALAMTGCPDGGGGGPPPPVQITITFDLNYTDAPEATVVKVTPRAALGSKYPAAIPEQDGYVFTGWNSEAEGTGNTITGNSKFSGDTTVYAIWAAYNSVTDVKVTFNYNYSGAAPATTVRVTTASNPVAGFPDTPGRQGYTFTGWFSTNGAPGSGGDRFTADSLAAATNSTVYARWAVNGTKANLEDDQVRFEYVDNTWQDVVFENNVTTWAQLKGKLARAKDIWPDESKAFKNWKDASNIAWTTDATKITSSTTFTADWLANTFSDTNGAEKVYGENASGYVVFEFTIPDGIADKDALLNNIKGIKASYQLSEAGVAANNLVPHRVFGPYFFDNTANTVAGVGTTPTRTYYGDFMLDNNNALVARFDGTASGPGNYNKFHSYMAYSGDGIIDGAENSASATASTWFTATINFSTSDDGKTPDAGDGKYSWGKTLRFIDSILDDGTEDSVQILPASPLPATKIYFALGISRRWLGSGAGKSGQQSPWDVGIISLIKDVKLLYEVDDPDSPGTSITSEILGVAPQLTVTKTDTAQTQVTTKQVFAGYVDPINFGWRGSPTAPIVIPPDPGYVAPPSVAPALSSYTLKNPGLVLYQNDAGKNTALDATRKRITINGNVINFNLTSGDYNNGGDFGGGGFKILFADVELPENYLAYKRIVLDCTVSSTDSSMIGAGNKQVIFSGTSGTDVQSVINNSAEAARYVDVVADANVFKFATTGLPSGTEGVALRVNNWLAANVPFIGSITVNRITFTID